MDVGGGKGGVKSDINVTPLVDVMLVLLIIMMLVAPMLQQGVAVKLPKADNTVDKPECKVRQSRDRQGQADLFQRQGGLGS
jgi:biopolymer transport protein ExbD